MAGKLPLYLFREVLEIDLEPELPVWFKIKLFIS